ncbi:daptide-type RiPP biosynthesis aminotransferase [Saccharothrix deserti]|uniref:daptide-type RiPP biosynthesis aminotransferase n=1 Tax=Saccharothrix deserti TaxID=2593674 RepID=UPI00131B89E4|nr:daptide-type RiPP biosynthesis aminotransferase [Saccharothrix deserti]
MTDSTGRYPLWELLSPPSTWGAPERTALRAEGTRVLYADGAWRLCATSGLWNVNLGYHNRRIVEAITDALGETAYFTLFRGTHRWAVEAAETLVRLAGAEAFGRVAFATSGGAANDLVMKVARQYWALRRQFRRRVVVGLTGSYHGLTYGSHALTGMSLAQSYYSVDTSLVRHVAHDDPAELKELLEREGDTIAAVVVEPVLGTGARTVPDAMLRALQELRRRHGFLLVADEVATGFGRTGPYFASARWEGAPDMLVMSKALTNGTCAAAAVLVSHEICAAFERGDAVLTHGETQAGSPATCAAILATVAEMERLQAVRRGTEVAARLDALLGGLAAIPIVAGSDGAGCFRAVRLAQDGEQLSDRTVADIVERVRGAGVVVSAGPSCLQLAPALIYSDEDVEQLSAVLHTVLAEVADERSAAVVAR